MISQDFAIGINKNQRWPGPGAILVPDLELVVVDHWVLQFVAKDDIADIVCLPFIFKFRRMNTDDH